MSLSCLLRRALLLHKPQPISHTSLINPAIARSRSVPLVLSLKRFNFSTSPAEVTATEEEQKPSEVVDHFKVKGRTVENIPVETSIRYLQSKAYSITYGADPVWKNYRRNFKGGIPPKKTRKTCIRSGKISTGNPCPICRDDYLVFSPDNVNLLKQFISPHSGETLSYTVTGVCQKRHRQLLGAIDIAKDRGSLTFDVPFRSYNYSDYKK